MGVSSPHETLPRLAKILTLSLYAILPLALLLLYLLSPPSIAAPPSTSTSPPHGNHLKDSRAR
jgi:hypothetical protein